MSLGYIVLYRLIDLESAVASGKGLDKAAGMLPPLFFGSMLDGYWLSGEPS